jgi:hypothetical protein
MHTVGLSVLSGVLVDPASRSGIVVIVSIAGVAVTGIVGAVPLLSVLSLVRRIRGDDTGDASYED